MAGPGDAPNAPAPDTLADEVSDWLARAFEHLKTDPAEANRLAAAAVAASEPDSSQGGRARHAFGLSECILGRVVNGRAHLLDATGALDRHGPLLAACRAWRDYASVMALVIGDAQAGVQAFERALALAEALDDLTEQGAVLSRLGPALGRAGRTGDACRVLERAIGLLTGGPDRVSLANALDNLGYQLIQQGDHAQAVPPLRAELALRDPAADRLHTANGRANLAVALAGSGEGAEALALLDGIPALLNPAKDEGQWAEYLVSVGTVSLLLGDSGTARIHLRRALDVTRRVGLHLPMVDTLGQLSKAEEQCGDLAAALRCERELRQAERQWLDEQTANRVKLLEAGIELAEKRAENHALDKARAELEQRVQERTAELHDQIRERDDAQRLARFWSDHDWLTRLPNRRQMQAQLERHLAQAVAQGGQLGVLFVDLDGFKAVNDAHGHLAGDRLLRLTARRLRQHAPPGAIVTRYGGDEFVVLLPRLAGSVDALQVAQRLRAAVLGRLKLEGRVVALSCSIGLAIGPRDARLPDELLRCADRAMLEAKQGGRNQVRELDAGGQGRLERRGRLRRELGGAIAGGRLSAAYQPLWDLRHGCLAGVELLARWHDPGLGWVSPADFIPVAEESGQIVELACGPCAKPSARRWLCGQRADGGTTRRGSRACASPSMCRPSSWPTLRWSRA